MDLKQLARVTFSIKHSHIYLLFHLFHESMEQSVPLYESKSTINVLTRILNGDSLPSKSGPATTVILWKSLIFQLNFQDQHHLKALRAQTREVETPAAANRPVSYPYPAIFVSLSLKCAHFHQLCPYFVTQFWLCPHSSRKLHQAPSYIWYLYGFQKHFQPS